MFYFFGYKARIYATSWLLVTLGCHVGVQGQGQAVQTSFRGYAHVQAERQVNLYKGREDVVGKKIGEKIPESKKQTANLTPEVVP